MVNVLLQTDTLCYLGRYTFINGKDFCTLAYSLEAHLILMVKNVVCGFQGQ